MDWIIRICYFVPVVRALDFWFPFMVFDFNVVILFIDLYSHTGSFCDKSCSLCQILGIFAYRVLAEVTLFDRSSELR